MGCQIRTITSNVKYQLTASDRKLIKSIIIVERKKRSGKLRKCFMCKMYKPDRTHHCRVCNCCILQTDHHCSWIANCVGWNNQKYFVLMQFYALLSLVCIIISMRHRFAYVFRRVVNIKHFISMDVPAFLTYILAIFFFSSLVSFFIINMRLILRAMTTVEMREKANNPEKEIRHRYMIEHIKYDQGYWKNFCHIAGPPKIWLLPIKAPFGIPSYDGTYAEPPAQAI